MQNLFRITRLSLLGFGVVLTIAACAGQSASVAPAPATAQSSDQPNTARGAVDPANDENIRQARGTNSQQASEDMVIPADKAPEGMATRGASSCRVHFDNRSRLYIATYADGSYRGELSPWGDVYSYVIAGPTRLYARAGFTDGSVSTWGPRMVECPAGGSYQWMLYYSR